MDISYLNLVRKMISNSAIRLKKSSKHPQLKPRNPTTVERKGKIMTFRRIIRDVFMLKVRGMGFEPMQPYGNRFLKTVPIPNKQVVLF